MSLLTPLKKFAGFQEEIQFSVLRRLHETPKVSQRALAKDLGVSLGTINYCCQALVETGLVKIQNFGRSKNKMSYAYLLTPTGILKKSELTAKFLMRKMAEHEKIRAEIEALRAEVDSLSGPDN